MKETPDMPVFTLIGSDMLAVRTVEYWMEEARLSGVSNEKLKKVQKHLDALKAWTIIKLPD